MFAVYKIILTFVVQLVRNTALNRERGENPRLSRSCKSRLFCRQDH